jgi:N-acetylmuramoyl-L-alanine amidase
MGRKLLRAVILAAVTMCLVISIPVLAQKTLQGTSPSPSYTAEGEPHAKANKIYGSVSCLGTAPNKTSVDHIVPAGDDEKAIHGAGLYLDCAIAKATGTIDQPVAPQPPKALISINPVTPSPATIIATANVEVAEVLANETISRIGPTSDANRVTPLPKGIKAVVVGRQEGDNNGKKATWVQLNYGGWVMASDLKITLGNLSPAIVQNIRSQNNNSNTDVLFALSVPVPLVIDQTEKTLKLTLYNTAASSSIVKMTSNPMIDRVESKSVAPGQMEYTFVYKSRQQWGYKYRYDGKNLVLSLRQPPAIAKQSNKPLTGVKILLDPGHGGADSGALSSTGYAEKDATLYAAKLLANELFAKGATVYLTRETDKAVSLEERRRIVEQLEPTISLSVHYNSSPEDVNPSKAKGFSVFWYHSQAQGLASFLHTYTTQYADRPKYGVIWDNLALARPAAAPSVLLELGFMSNPEELQWISNPQAQQQMAKTLASGITQWFMTAT